MSAETPGGDSGVTGSGAGAGIRWLGGGFWGVWDGIFGSLSPRVGGDADQPLQLQGTLEAADIPDPDYEGLPNGASTSTHMLAGAVAGIMEHCLMYPIDCVKLCFTWVGTYPGQDPVSCGSATRFNTAFDKAGLTWVTDASAAGCVATLLHDAMMNPAEVVKQRMQMYNSPYRSVLDCMRAVWLKEGAAAFYRSYTTQLTMNIPFQALHFVTYEYLQETLNPHRQYNPTSHMVSGALAGAVAAAATTPLDVCKTLLNTQESLALHSLNVSGHISGLAHAFRTVYRLGGVLAYFKGVQARIIYQMPSTAIAWTVYEFFKYVITEHQHAKRKAQR
ncbi:UNVERIFIED_CONTAM: hypothetical protein FKN15_071471 [Acipenser sinensis]